MHPAAALAPERTRDDLWRVAVFVWAADLRDRRCPAADHLPDAAVFAGALCRVLDALDHRLRSGGEVCGLEELCGELLDRLLELGLRPPSPFGG
jgi:hypothetical protein